MRVIPFRSILWGVAYKDGLDPATNLLVDQADAYASYINQWVRRLYDAEDHPEWTEIIGFEPDPTTHIVKWDQPIGSQTVTQFFTIGRVFKIYLLDPRTTWLPVDTPHRLTPDGIHCGFDHGPLVWIKFIRAAPVFTAQVWDANRTYFLGELTYSPVTGECYRSRIAGNFGHDPAGTGDITGNNPLQTEITQQAALDNPGLAVTAKKMSVTLAVVGDQLTIPDPPPSVSRFAVKVYDATGTVIAGATIAPSGSQSLATIAAALDTALTPDPDLASFTITTAGNVIQFTDLSDYTLSGSYQPKAADDVIYPMPISQQQAYVPAMLSTASQAQIAKITITDAQVKTNTMFRVVFADALGIEHAFSYNALVNDSALQVANGLLSALATASIDDPFLAAVQASTDPTGAILFTTEKTTAVSGTFTPASPVFWDIVPFPLALANQVIRGAYADSLKEKGQTDKAQLEEQAVPLEQQLEAATQMSQQYDLLTDQQAPKTRYSISK